MEHIDLEELHCAMNGNGSADMKKQVETHLNHIGNLIRFVRGQRVLLDADLAVLYGVEVKQLKRQVRRNIRRFPPDFMFQLTAEEAVASRCQNGTLKRGQNIKYAPYAFTQEGVAMLSGPGQQLVAREWQKDEYLPLPGTQ